MSSFGRNRPPVLLFILADLKFFFSHRQWLAIAAQKAGYRVHLACPDAETSQSLKEIGVLGHALDIQAGGMNPIKDMKTVRQIKKLAQQIQPDIVHAVGVKSILPSALALRSLKGVSAVFHFTGLGYLFTNQSFKVRCVRTALWPMFRYGFSKKNSVCVFQNPDDRQELMRARLVKSDQTVLIEGSGIDTEEYSFTPLPKNKHIIILMPGRLLIDKGIREFIQAAKKLKKRHPDIDFKVAGDRDPKNPSCISEEERDAALDAVEFLGHRDDMAWLYQQADIICLPSYREGLPRALLEAAALGRPLVATNVPGCRQVVDHGVNGLLVEAQNSDALAEALETLSEDADMRAAFGRKSRALAEEKFSMTHVNEQMLSLYNCLLKIDI